MMPTTSFTRHLLSGVVTLAFAFLFTGWLSGDLGAQAPGKKPVEEEEEPGKPKVKPPPAVDSEAPRKGPKKEEEEEPGPRRKSKKVIVPDDDDTRPAKPPQEPQGRPPDDFPNDLALAAKETKNPELQKLFRELSTPHDTVTMAQSGRTYFVEPLRFYYANKRPKFPGGYLKVRSLDAEDWRPSSNSMELLSQSAETIQPFEEIVVERVNQFLEKKLDQLPEASKAYLSRKDMLKAAAVVLAEAERFHVSARERKLRQGDEWDAVRARLHKRLFEVRLEQLRLFINADDWDGAANHARDMAEAYPDPEEREPIARLLVELIKKELQGEVNDARLRDARRRLMLLERYLPGSRAAGSVALGLKTQAEALFKEAKELRDKGRNSEALERMKLAEEIWPNLPELSDDLHRLMNTYPILRVGVRELPVYLLPGLATTDVERQAGELIFEGLVRLRQMPGGVQIYEPVLAAGMPRLVPMGREFRLARGATWSDGTPVGSPDIVATLRQLRNANPALGRLLVERPEVGDAFRLSLNLRQGYLDPMSLMTFKVLPRQGLAQPLAKFNSEPVGSGPFKYAGQPSTPTGRKYAAFLANPHYASRENCLGLPRIREVHFLLYTAPEDPVDALLKGEVDLVTRVPAARLKDLRPARGVTFTDPLPNRRVYFLAINHRRPPFEDSPDLRQALALAIDREKLLDNHFRGGLEPARIHKALNGPFPAGSWACDKTIVPPSLHRPEQAKTLINRATAKTGKAVGPLVLKYPANEPGLDEAMKELAGQVREAIGVELRPEPVEPHKLREDVEKTHSYDLAYYWHDYASDAYWLWPLFDPNAAEQGSNYLGYTDGELVAALGRAMGHRDFALVQEEMRVVHRLLYRQMPLIPLWQLDTIIAYRNGVRPTALDPLLVFTDIEHWTKETQR